MRRIRIARSEQELSERATETFKQMTELKQLRELIRLAEAASRPRGLARARSIRKSSIRLPDFDCATSQRGHLPRPAQVADG